MQLSHTVSILCPRPLKMLNTTTHFSYNLKKHILSKILWGQSSVNPFYAYLNNHLTFHLISKLCGFCYVLKIKAMPIWAKNIKYIKIIGLVYSSKFNMCTSLTQTLHLIFSLFVLPACLWMITLLFLQITKVSALLKLNIYTSRC
jgi:hypothetical protein